MTTDLRVAMWCLIKEIEGGGGDRLGSKFSDGSGPVPPDEIFRIGLEVPTEKTESMEKLEVAHLGNIFFISYETSCCHYVHANATAPCSRQYEPCVKAHVLPEVNHDRLRDNYKPEQRSKTITVD